MKNARDAIAHVDALLTSEVANGPTVVLEALAALETRVKEAGLGKDGEPATVRSTELGPPKVLQAGKPRGPVPDPDEQMRMTLRSERPPDQGSGEAAEEMADTLRRIGEVKAAVIQGREPRAVRDMWNPLADQLRKRYRASP